MTRRIASALMASGVTIEDPERFDADEEVQVGSGFAELRYDVTGARPRA